MATYAERYAHRRSLGLKVLQSLGNPANGADTTIPAPLVEGYTRPYYAQPRGIVDRTPLPCEKPMAWFLAKIKRDFKS